MKATKWKARGRAGVIAVHQESLELARLLLDKADRLEAACTSDERVRAEFVAALQRRPKSKWFFWARTFVKCGKIPQAHASYIANDVRRLLGEMVETLVENARDAGHDLKDAQDLQTLLLELDLSLPYVTLVGDVSNLTGAFDMLRMAQDLGISEFGPLGSSRHQRRRTRRDATRDRAFALRRQQVIAVACLLRLIGLTKSNRPFLDELRAHFGQRSKADAAEKNEVLKAVSDAKRIAKEIDEKAERDPPNRLSPEQLEVRHAKWKRMRTIQADAIRLGRQVKDRDAWSGCGMNEKEFNQLRRNARDYGWPDPRHAARSERIDRQAS